MRPQGGRDLQIYASEHKLAPCLEAAVNLMTEMVNVQPLSFCQQVCLCCDLHRLLLVHGASSYDTTVFDLLLESSKLRFPCVSQMVQDFADGRLVVDAHLQPSCAHWLSVLRTWSRENRRKGLFSAAVCVED